MTRWWTQIAAGCLIAAAVIPRVEPAAAQTLRIGLAEDPDLLDPTLARSFVGRIVFASLCDKLFDIGPELDIVPQLATEWRWTDGNTGLVIKLRPGVKFHDGEPLDAAAVKFSIERHLTMPGSNRKGEISAVTGVDIIDDHTAKLVLSAPFAPLLAQLTDRAGMVMSPKRRWQRAKISAPIRFAQVRSNLSNVSRKTALSWSASAITGTRTRSSSTASSICQSPTRQYGLPTSGPAGST
jgi:ABC-type transport system substrate-binding protein